MGKLFEVRYVAVASDYDGTLASQGKVSDATLATLKRLRLSGRRLVLVTGRELDDLLSVFPEISLFDRVVAENGGLLYTPSTLEQRPLGDAPPKRLGRCSAHRRAQRSRHESSFSPGRAGQLRASRASEAGCRMAGGSQPGWWGWRR